MIRNACSNRIAAKFSR